MGHLLDWPSRNTQRAASRELGRAEFTKHLGHHGCEDGAATRASRCMAPALISQPIQYCP
jgi:hypothetical protein